MVDLLAEILMMRGAMAMSIGSQFCPGINLHNIIANSDAG